MTITLPDELAERLHARARDEGLTVEALLDGLLAGDWAEDPDYREDPSEIDEIREAVAEGLDQARRGEGRPANEVFAELRARHGIPDRN